MERWSYTKDDIIKDAFYTAIWFKDELMKEPIWDNLVDGQPKGWRTDYAKYCKHGINLGDPYGADHLCGHCEDGTPNEVLEDKVYIHRLEKVIQNWEALALDLARHIEHGLPFESPLEELKIGKLPS